MREFHNLSKNFAAKLLARSPFGKRAVVNHVVVMQLSNGKWYDYHCNEDGECAEINLSSLLDDDYNTIQVTL